MEKRKKFLVKHVGNMGDMLFLVPPALETLKKKYPDCHITLVTAWGYKQKGRLTSLRLQRDDKKLRLQRKFYWGKRNQGGYCIALMMTNPHIDQLVHYSNTELSLEGTICREEGRQFPTWSASYYQQQKKSGMYDDVFELDFGIGHSENPIAHMYEEVLKMPGETYGNYKLYFTDKDMAVAQAVMGDVARPRIVFLEGIEGVTTRGWDPEKVQILDALIEKEFGVSPRWFGAKHIPTYKGRALTLRENIATLSLCDVAIGVMSGPMHFAAAAGIPTITLYADQSLHRAAPAYFLNPYIQDSKRLHRTILGSTNYSDLRFLKDEAPFINLTPEETRQQSYMNWQNPGKQRTKSALSVITPEEVLLVVRDILYAD